MQALYSKLLHGIRSPAFRSAFLVFIIFRLFLTFWMWGVRQVFTDPLPPHPVLRPYLDVERELNPWLEPWQRWDTLHYMAIAERGYLAFNSATFAPPLYPMLIRWLSSILGGNILLAGIIISNISFLFFLVLLYKVAFQETKQRDLAQRTLLYFASFPAAFFLLAAYTEALYLLAAILALYFAQNRKWWQSGIWGAIAALTRLPGVIIILPLLYAAWRDSRQNHRMLPWSAVILTVLGSLIFPLYLWLGFEMSPWLPLQVQYGRFSGHFTIPGLNVFFTIRNILNNDFYMSDILDLIFILVFIACTPFVWKRLSKIYVVYHLVLLGMLLTRLSNLQPLLSTARYVIALFPAFIIFATWGKNPSFNRIYLYLSWFCLLFMAAQFALWGWVG